MSMDVEICVKSKSEYDQFQGNIDESIYMKTFVINILECRVFVMICNLNSSSHFSVIVYCLFLIINVLHIYFKNPAYVYWRIMKHCWIKLMSLLNPCLGRDFDGFYDCGGYIWDGLTQNASMQNSVVSRIVSQIL